MKRMLLMINPISGKREIRGKLVEVLDTFNRAGYRVETYITKGRGDFSRVAAKAAPHFDVVVVSGGDGSLNEAISGIMALPEEQRPIFGHLPSGSTNDFAKSLRLPDELLPAARAVAHGNTVPVDVGSLNGDSFLYVTGFGALTEISYVTSQEVKNVLGHSAYFLNAARSLWNIRPHYTKVTWEGGEFSGNLLVGIVTNTVSVGGFKGVWGYHMQLGDGLYEMLLVERPPALTDMPGVLMAVLDGKKTSPYVHKYHIRKAGLSATCRSTGTRTANLPAVFRRQQSKTISRLCEFWCRWVDFGFANLLKLIIGALRHSGRVILWKKNNSSKN